MDRYSPAIVWAHIAKLIDTRNLKFPKGGLFPDLQRDTLYILLDNHAGYRFQVLISTYLICDNRNKR